MKKETNKEENIITYFIKDKEQQTLKEFAENEGLDSPLVMYAKIKKSAPLTTLWKRLDTGGFYHWFKFNNDTLDWDLIGGRIK